ncbi:MAG: hypothetical protein ABL928_06915 [Sphingorhabdus sp.]
MINILYSALALVVGAPEIPTIEQAEADPRYVRVESRQLVGKCATMTPLAKMLSNNDGVQEITEVACDNVVFTPPSDGENAATEGLMTFVMSTNKSGTYFRGIWNDGDFNLNEISFDQQSWFKVSKGRVRVYKNDEADTMMFVGFAVFENGKRRGVAFRFEN